MRQNTRRGRSTSSSFCGGGGNDIIARVFGQKLSEDLGRRYVENKPGAARSSPPNMSPRRRQTAPRSWSAPAAWAINQRALCQIAYDSIRVSSRVRALCFAVMVGHTASTINRSPSLWPTPRQRDKMNYSSSSPVYQLVTELFKADNGAPDAVILTKRQRVGVR